MPTHTHTRTRVVRLISHPPPYTDHVGEKGENRNPERGSQARSDTPKLRELTEAAMRLHAETRASKRTPH